MPSSSISTFIFPLISYGHSNYLCNTDQTIKNLVLQMVTECSKLHTHFDILVSHIPLARTSNSCRIYPQSKLLSRLVPSFKLFHIELQEYVNNLFSIYSPSYVHGFFQVQRRLNLENVELTISIRNLDLFACRIVFMNQNQLCSVYKLKSIQGFGTCKPKDEDNSLRPCRLRSCKLP